MSQETISLKIADSTDSYVVIDLINELYNYSSYSKVAPFDRDFAKDTFIESLSRPDLCTVLLRVDSVVCGVLCMSVSPSPANPSISFAVELAFWIRPEYRTRQTLKTLLEAYYHWAKLQGCTAAYVGKITKTRAPETYYIRKV